MQKETLLQMKDVHVHYGGVKALDGVDIAIDEGKPEEVLKKKEVMEAYLGE